jgi:hypothetical protein
VEALDEVVVLLRGDDLTVRHAGPADQPLGLAPLHLHRPALGVLVDPVALAPREEVGERLDAEVRVVGVPVGEREVGGKEERGA